MNTSVCAFTSVCEEDAGWLDQYLGEAERLEMPFVMHFDRCSRATKTKVLEHRLCVEFSMQDRKEIEFTEQHKQAPFDLVKKVGFGWAMAWDIDETYERDAGEKLASICQWSTDQVCGQWLNLWGDKHHIRVDHGFAEGTRVKFYNLAARKWVFDHPITNGPKLVDRATGHSFYNLVTLHWGMMTHELRIMHKSRWDRIYSTALRGDSNPYGFWKLACDESINPVVVRHGYHQ